MNYDTVYSTILVQNTLALYDIARAVKTAGHLISLLCLAFDRLLKMDTMTDRFYLRVYLDTIYFFTVVYI